MQDSTRKTLDLYIKIARRLANGNFVKYVRENNVIYEMRVNRIGQTTQIAIPVHDMDTLGALGNNLRYFLQPNEPISFKNLPQIYEDMSQNWAVAAENFKDRLETYLAQSPLSLEIDNASVTLRNIKEVFLYGDISHSSKIDRFEQWEASPTAFPFMRFCFENAAVEIIETVVWIAFLIERELTGNKIPSPNSSLLWRRLSKVKERGEWRRITPLYDQKQNEELKRRMSAAELMSFDEFGEPQLTLSAT